MAYVIDQLAQRWSTTPVWIEEECSLAWREAGIAFMSIEADVQNWRAGQKDGHG